MKVDVDTSKNYNDDLIAAFKARGLAVSHAISSDTIFRMLELIVDKASYKFSLVIDNGDRKWISSLGSYDSYDGEYVPMFIEFKHEVEPISRFLEEYGSIGASIVEYTYPQGKSSPLDTPILINVLYWVAKMWYLIRKNRPSSFLLRPEMRLLELFDPVFDSININDHWISFVTFSHFPKLITPGISDHYTTLGVKMYPTRHIHAMTSLPLVMPYNEIYCLQLCNKFIRDRMCNLFPQYYGNIIVDGSNVHLFQNSGMMERFKRNEDTLAEIEKITQNIDFQMDALVREQIETSQKMLRDLTVMDGKVIMIFMQHMLGWSPWNIRDKISESHTPLETQIFVFDIMYSLYLLACNYVFHCDLHLGNLILQNSPLHFRRVSYNRYTLPKPSKSMMDFVRGEIEGADEAYDPERNLTANVFITTTKFGPLGAEPIRPKYTEELQIMRPSLIHTTSIIDFSRAVVMNPDAFDGIQPYRAELLSRNFQQLHTAVRTLGDEIIGDLENVNNELKFCAAAEDHMTAVFRAIEGIDMYMLFKKLGEMKAPKETKEEHQARFAAFQATIKSIAAVMLRSIRGRLSMLNDGRYDLLNSVESIYPALIAEFCPLLQDPHWHNLEGYTVDVVINTIKKDGGDPNDIRFVYDFRA